MTAANQQRDEAAKQAARLRALAEQVAEPAVAGRDGGKALKAKHRNDWRRITDVVCAWEHKTRYIGLERTPERLAEEWKGTCNFAGIGVGWLANWLFWNWAFPLLLELAKRWIESNRNQEQTGDR